MEYPILNQQKYSQEVGTGQGYSIAKFGCAEVDLTSLVNYYGHHITPDVLNLNLVGVQGFADNGTGNKTLLVWSAISRLYPEIALDKNIAYPATPADMNLIDSYLAEKMPVIVGVSFTHNPTDTLPNHYVVIYQKNADGTYQCMDPWFGDSAVFDNRYGVNGMSVSNAILQVVCYVGTPPAQNTPQNAPHAASEQSAQTIEDQLRADRDKNWNLYMQQVDLAKQKDARIQELQTQAQQLQDANTKLQTEIADTKTLNGTLASQLAALEKNDSAAVTQLQTQIASLQDKADAADTAADALNTKPTKFNLLSALDIKLSEISFLRRKVKEQTPIVPPPPRTQLSTMQLLGIKGVKKL